jgi:sulfur carrier protein ThiS
MINIKLPVNDNEIKDIVVEYKNMTIDEIIAELKIDKQHIGAVLVNGVPKKISHKVEDNSVLYFLPILSGG